MNLDDFNNIDYDNTFNEDNIKEDFNSQAKKSYNKTTSNEDDDNSKGESTTNNNFGCNDIPGGFQTLNPEIFNIIAEILGDVMSGKLPFNVQNAVGNWIQLVGQAIETYSTQQQYFQSGPGRYYNLKYYNVTNPFCSSSENCEGTQATNEQNSNENNSNGDVEMNSNNANDELINLTSIINNLQKDINEMKCRLNKIENKKL